MKILVASALVLGLLSNFCFADGGDDTLKQWISKSDLIISGTIVSEPIGVTSEMGVPNYICEFKVVDVCKGDVELKGKTIKINIKRFEMVDKDHHPLIKKDDESILFLKRTPKGNKPQWETADFWFGIQHPSPWMVKSLKRCAQEPDSK